MQNDKPIKVIVNSLELRELRKKPLKMKVEKKGDGFYLISFKNDIVEMMFFTSAVQEAMRLFITEGSKSYVRAGLKHTKILL